MAKLNQCGIGIFSGKVGNVVGARYKNQNILRAYQPVVTNPKSTKQVIARTKFSELTKLIAKAYNINVKKQYGTKYTFVYQRWIQMVATSIMYQAINAPKNDVGDIIIKKFPSIISNSIGLNYDEEGLNIFSQSQVELQNDSIMQYPYLQFKGAISPLGTQEPFKRFFGCDYILPNKILCLSAVSLFDNDHNFGNPIIIKESVIKNTFATQTNPIGTRNRGMYTSADLCGSNWKYIYEIDPGNAGTIENPAIIAGYGNSTWSEHIIVENQGIVEKMQLQECNVLWLKSPENERINAIDIIGNLSIIRKV